MSEKKKKTVKVDFQNSEGRLKLTIKGKNATENALKIMRTFDNACSEIKDKNKE